MYFVSKVFNGKVYVMPRPRMGDWLEDEIRRFRHAGITGIVSLLTPAENCELDLTAEAQLCDVHGLSFYGFSIADRGVPESGIRFVKFIGTLCNALQDGASLAIHCRAGIGRAGMTAASLLIASGMRGDGAFELVENARGRTVPDTPEQREWVLQMADMLRHGGCCSD